MWMVILEMKNQSFSLNCRLAFLKYLKYSAKPKPPQILLSSWFFYNVFDFRRIIVILSIEIHLAVTKAAEKVTWCCGFIFLLFGKTVGSSAQLIKLLSFFRAVQGLSVILCFVWN